MSKEAIFREIYNKNYGKIVCFISSIVKDKTAAEDISQLVFIIVFQKLQVIDFSKPIEPLLFHISKNKAIEYLRSKSTHAKYRQDFQITNSALFIQEEYYFAENKLQEIYAIVNKMPEEYQKIFNLSKIEGFSIAETAIKLNISSKRVYYLLTKILIEIKKGIED